MFKRFKRGRERDIQLSMDLTLRFLFITLLSLTQGIEIEEEVISASKQDLQVVKTVRESKTNFSGTFNANYSVPGSHDDLFESNDQLSKELSYETAWTGSGRRKLTLMRIINSSVDFNQTFPSEYEPTEVEDNDDLPSVLRKRFRQRRQLFGQHRRFYIPTRSFAQRFPFQVVVKISTGCTGTAVSTRHILTSAHCLHTGKDYAKGFRSLRVGFLLANKTVDWIDAQQVKLPLAWVQGNDTDASRLVIKYLGDVK